MATQRLLAVFSAAVLAYTLPTFAQQAAMPAPLLVAFAGGEGRTFPAVLTATATPGSAAVGWSSSAAVSARDGEVVEPVKDGAAGGEGPADSSGFLQAIAGSRGMRPFSALGVAVKVGVEGVGFDVATPLAQRFNLRAGASFFSYTHSFVTDGITINPDIKFRKGAASLDYYPFAGSFRISPGVVFYNGNHATATANVPAGATFTLNDVTYTSSSTDPVRGSAEISFGNKAAPSITVGFGNMIPRKGGHWSVPFEVGFAYIGRPAFVYNLAGSACNQFGCMNVATNPDIQANLKAEQNELNDDIAPLRFYPILSVGVGYRF